MASQEGCVTVTWKIRNFGLFLKAGMNWGFFSPNWIVSNKKRWGVMVASEYYSTIEFSVHGFGDHRIRTEMFFISSNGIVLLKQSTSGLVFFLERKAFFDESGQSIFLNDTMTLCFRAWGRALTTSECHIVTVLHGLNHLWTIEKLASSDSHATYIDQENVKIYISLKKKKNWTSDWEGIVELEPCVPGFCSVDYALSIKDSCGKVLNYQKNASTVSECLFSINIISNITGVTIQLELIVALNGRHELSASSQVVKGAQLNSISRTTLAKHMNISSAVGADLLLLYRESALSDATLHTAGKSFSAHRTVLAARSPVFRAMFEKDETSEGQSGVVDIDDVDSDTVDRMLVYLYADLVGDLEWKEASALYYAANKYAILPLQEKCADILEACLGADNACDVLVLADRHSDQALTTRVVNFILAHEEVVSSAQWKELEKGDPMLCAKITRELFLKKGEKMRL